MSQCFVSMHIVEVLAHVCFFGYIAVVITVTDNENEDENGSVSCDFYTYSAQCISSLILFLCTLLLLG